MRDLIDPTPTPSAWEEAYLRFETPKQEVRKFQGRLELLGANGWSRSSRIVELCCGRGSGLQALRSFGFQHIEGLDLSPALVATYEGPGVIILGDVRVLPFSDRSRDILIVQGGLHHLGDLRADLPRALTEAARVLAPDGRFVMVEPWLTPFLRIVHAVSETAIARRLSRKVDAFATMTDHERPTYEAWLSQPQTILAELRARFQTERHIVGWGKLMFVGRPRPQPN